MDPMTSGFFQTPQTNFNGPKPLLRFYTEAVEIPGETVKGRPIYENRDFVAIINPGSRDEVVRIAKDKAKQDPYVAHAYKVWKDTRNSRQTGRHLNRCHFSIRACQGIEGTEHPFFGSPLRRFPTPPNSVSWAPMNFRQRPRLFWQALRTSAHATHLAVRTEQA